MKKNTLILGLGNDILTDDRIGPQIVRDLDSLVNSGNLHFDIAASGGFEILENIRGFERVIIIDAILTPDGRPGDIFHIRPSELKCSSFLPSFHDINFITAIDLGKSLYSDLTGDLHIIAIAVHEAMEFGEDFSAPVKERYEEILINVAGIINEIEGNDESELYSGKFIESSLAPDSGQ